MHKLLISTLLFLSLCGLSVAQETGAIHGTVPTAHAVRVGLADLQTPEGQGWYDGLQSMAGHREQTDYVCRTEPPMATTANDEQFDFYELPPGSYEVSACLQNDGGGWYEGSAIVQVKEGETADVVFGESTVARYGVYGSSGYDETVVVSTWEPFWGFNICIGCWHYRYVWYYHPFAYRCAPFWLTPGVVIVERPVFIPREYHYREHPYYRRGGSFAPPRQQYHHDGYRPPASPHSQAQPRPQTQPHPQYQPHQTQPRPEYRPQARPRLQYQQRTVPVVPPSHEEHHASPPAPRPQPPAPRPQPQSKPQPRSYSAPHGGSSMGHRH